MNIKIVSGAYGLRPAGTTGVVKTIRAGQVCDVPQDEADRLVSLGVAEYVTPVAVATPPHTPPDNAGGNTTPDGEEPPVTLSGGLEVPDVLDIVDGHFTEESLSTMTKADLTALAGDMELDVSKCKNKTDIVALLASVELDITDTGDDDDDDEAEDDGEEPPTPGAEPPVQ